MLEEQTIMDLTTLFNPITSSLLYDTFLFIALSILSAHWISDLVPDPEGNYCTLSRTSPTGAYWNESIPLHAIS